MDPIRVKVYGLFPLTRRRYLFQAACGAICFFALLVAWWLYGPELSERLNRMKQTTWITLVHHVLAAAPWVLLGVAVIKVVEMYFVLRRFAAKEAKARRKAPAIDSERSIEPPRSPTEGVSEGSG
jgi:hypothetical protein